MTEPTPATGDVLAQLADHLRQNQVFGAAIRRKAVTVVPVGQIRAGGVMGG